MNEESLSPLQPPKPELRIPGWEVRVYVETSSSHGRNALEKAILGLIKAGVPGVSGSLARELSIQENVVEVALDLLEEEGLLELDDMLFRLVEERSPEDEQVVPTQGWMFWDALRKSFLPVLVLDGHPNAPEDPGSCSDSDELGSFREKRPSHEEIRRDFMSAVEHRDLVVLGPPSRSTQLRSTRVGSADLRRVSPIGGRRCLNWRPLLVPYLVTPTLGEKAEIHFLEPVHQKVGEIASSYSPYLRAVIETELPGSVKRITDYADELQTRFLKEQGAPFLAARGGVFRVTADARDAVFKMLGSRTLPGPFGTDQIFQAACDAEMVRMMVEPLSLTPDALRTPFSRILQILGRLVADDIKPRWLRQSYKLGLSSAWFHVRKESQAAWKSMLRDFDQKHHTTIDAWQTPPPFDHIDKAKYRDGFKLSQLGSVLRSWGAIAVAAEGEPDGKFCLAWIQASLREFPDLFEVFDAIKDQRNMDKNRSSIGISVEEYRKRIYQVWLALGRGYNTAIKELRMH
jgi:hypothetical protein